MIKGVREAVENYLTTLSPGKLLDVPAGTGWIQQVLGKEGWEYHGADLYTDTSKPNFKKANLNDSLPYEDETFDYVVCLEGLEHIENPHHVLREFQRILKPKGQLLISTPNPLNTKSRRRYFREGTFYGFPHLVNMPKDGEHVHITPINLSFLIAFAEKYGLSLDQVHPVKIRPSMLRFLPRSLVVKFFAFLRYRNKDPKTKQWMKQLSSFNILLNDGMVVSFKRR